MLSIFKKRKTAKVNKKITIDEVFEKIPQKAMNNVWYEKTNSDTVIVFVHGIFSDSRTCWLQVDKQDMLKSTYWPELVKTDPRFCNPSIFLAGFYTSRNSSTYEIRDCASEVYNALKRKGIADDRSPLDYPNIIFVTHSTGGIVVRYLLERESRSFIEKKVGLALIASPSNGSVWANRTDSLAKVFNNKLSQQLKLGNVSLEEIDDRFRQLVHERKIPRLKGIEAYENHFIVRGFILARSKIVEKESAGRYFGAPRQLPDTDHSSCVKPTGHDHCSHTMLVDFCTDVGVINKKTNGTMQCDESVTIPAAKDNNVSSVLFDVYRPEYEDYYIERSLDEAIVREVNVNSVWVSGTSGCGKTCMIRRNLCCNGGGYIYISLANHYDSSTLELIREINDELRSYNKMAGGVDVDTMHELIKDTVSVLCNTFNDKTIVHIEEIPIRDDDSLRDFLKYLASIVISYSERASMRNVKFVLSSIISPEDMIKPCQDKIREKFKFIHVDGWDDDDVGKLICMISDELGVDIEDKSKSKLIDSSKGSPRFIKKFFSNLMARNRTIGDAFELVLSETKRELS